MGEKFTSSIVSALIGGLVGAMVVSFVAGKTKFDSLEVGNLKITKSATLLNAEGKNEVEIRDGSVLANNVVLGKKFIGTQYQGHVFVGNRIFTSPDNLLTTPMENWRFFTEMGSMEKSGGQMIVRSPNGPNVVGKEVNSGMMLQLGFDEGNGLQLFAKDNTNGMMMPAYFHKPQVAKAPSPETLAASLADSGVSKPATKPETKSETKPETKQDVKPQTAAAQSDPVK